MAVLSLSQNLSQTFNQFANPVLLAAIKWECKFQFQFAKHSLSQTEVLSFLND